MTAEIKSGNGGQRKRSKHKSGNGSQRKRSKQKKTAF